MKKCHIDRTASRRIFKTCSGQIRAVWIIIIGIMGYLAVFAGFPFAYWAGYYALLGKWGVNARNVAQAPGWVINSIEAAPAALAAIQAALAVAVIAVCLRVVIKKQPRRDEQRDALKKLCQCAIGVLFGMICVLACGALLLLTDSSRLGRRLTEPRLALIHAWVAVSIVSGAAAGEVFTRKYIIEALEGCARKSIIYCYSIAFFILLCGFENRTPLSLVNWALMGAALCAMYYRTGHMWMGVGFRTAWSVMIYIVAGFPEAGGGGIYEVYAASRYWLNGGDAGLMNGFISTGLLSAACLLLIRPWNRRPLLRILNRTPPRSSCPGGASGTSRRSIRRR